MVVQMQANRFVTEFHTNWITRFETNFVDLFVTNKVTRTITNTFAVAAFQTNLVAAYRTNLETLNLTNWTTVVAFRTNWINRPMTNLVAIELPRESAQPVLAAATTQAPNEPLSLQANRNAKLTPNNQVEVQLTVKWAQTPSAAVQVQQWRVEREDGSILCFGQDPEFKRALPVGTYKVTVKAQRDASSPLFAALGTLTVTSREVLFEQRPAHSNSSI
jgi:hypothetical protein